MATLATIKGIPYEKGQAFVCAADATGWSISNGSGLYTTLTKDTTYYLTLYEPGAKYPYGVGSNTAESSTLGWFDTTPFPAGTFTVTYDANGGDLNGIAKTQTKTYDIKIYVPSTEPVRTGYTFQGWSVPDRDIDYVYYMPNNDIEYNGNQTLKAVWTENILTVNYYSGGATYGTLHGVEIEDLSSLIGVSEFAYATEEANGLWDVQEKDRLYLERKNYDATGYWLYEGNKIDQTWPCTGAELANFLGVDISTSSKSIDIIPEWKQRASTVTVYVPQTDGTVKLRRGIVHVYDESSKLCYGIITIYDKNGKGHLAN